MKALLALAPLLTIAAAEPAAPVRDAAGNQVVALQVMPGGAADKDKPPRLMCAADRTLCVQLAPDGDGESWQVQAFRHVPAADEAPAGSSPIEQEDINSKLSIWPQVVVGADGRLLIGVIDTASAFYSGGGAHRSTTTLFEVGPGKAEATEVLSVPTDGSASIRACFSEKDQATRAGSCDDEYEFGAALTLDPATGSGAPRLRLTTHARTWPGRVSRSEDNSLKKLSKQDLRWADDPGCSYTRLFTRSTGARTYSPDSPLPACTDYLQF